MSDPIELVGRFSMVIEAVQLRPLCNMGIKHAGAHFTGALYREIIEFTQNRHHLMFSMHIASYIPCALIDTVAWPGSMEPHRYQLAHPHVQATG
jgi:hypothetical protein